MKRKIKVFLVVVVIAIEEEITNKKKESEEKNVKNLHEDKKKLQINSIKPIDRYIIFV